MCRKEVAWNTIVPCKSAFLKLKIDRGAYEHYIDGCESISSSRGKLSSFFSGVLGSVKADLHGAILSQATSSRHAYDTKKSRRILKHALKPYDIRGLKSVVSVL